MESLLPALALLACPVGMGLMMLFMMKSQRQEKPPPVPRSLEQMREEQRRLEEEIDRLEGPGRPTSIH